MGWNRPFAKKPDQRPFERAVCRGPRRKRQRVQYLDMEYTRVQFRVSISGSLI